MNAHAIITILLTAWIIIVPNSATAHPLGNFSISHYSGIRVSKDAIELRYMIDMAEIPTFQEIQESGIEPKAGDLASKLIYRARLRSFTTDSHLRSTEIHSFYGQNLGRLFFHQGPVACRR